MNPHSTVIGTRNINKDFAIVFEKISLNRMTIVKK